MPIVFACICPGAIEPGAQRTAAAVAQLAEELRSAAPEVALIVLPPAPARSGTIGATAQGADGELARRILQAAEALTIPAAELPAPDPLPCPQEVRDALAGARLVVVWASVLATREHIELGRALARGLGEDARRTAVVCCATLSRAHGPSEPGDLFDRHYRRAIEEWDVKWLAGLDSDTRRRAREDCVAQTALLMGALSRSRLQARTLSYEAANGVGLLVAAIEILGDRRKKRAV